MQMNFARRTGVFSTLLSAPLPLDAALAAALTSAAELRMEVTFDLNKVEPDTFLYVDLLNATQDKALHVSFRPEMDIIVLNTRDSEGWGQSVQVDLTMDILRFWRFWVIVGSDGNFRVELGSATLCEMTSIIELGDIAFCQSNISAHCVLAEQHNPEMLCGVLDASDPENAKALLKLDLATCIDVSQVWNDGHYTNLSPEMVEPVLISDQHWTLFNLGPTETDSVRLQIAQQEVELLDVRKLPVVEISSADIVLRTTYNLRADTVSWADTIGQTTDTRLTTTDPGDSDMQRLSFQRHLTPLSEFLRLIPEDGALSQLTLSVLGKTWHMSLGETVYSGLEARAKLLAENAHGLSNEWKMVCLDWWSILQISGQSALMQTTAPFLHDFLLRHGENDGGSRAIREVLGDVMPLGAAQSVARGQQNPTPQNIVLWQALRIVCGAMVSPASMRTAIEQQLSILPAEVRNWFLMELSPFLLDMGMGDILRDSLQEDFIQECLADDQPVWVRSTIVAALVALGRVEECTVIVENLLNASTQTLNIHAIAAATMAANGEGLKSKKRYRLIYAFTRLINSFGSQDFGPFRHRALINALIAIIKNSTQDAYWFQRDLLRTVETNYSTVPEFWQAFNASTAKDTDTAFLQECREVAIRADHTNKFMCSVTAGTANNQTPSRAAMAGNIAHFSAEGERKKYLNTFLGLHGVAGLAHSDTTHAMCRDMLLRELAHPFTPEQTLSETALPVQSMRGAISDLQRFPTPDHKHILETLGRMLLKGDAAGVINYFKVIITDHIADSKAEAIILDAVAWALTAHVQDNRVLNALILQLLNRIEGCISLTELPPAIEAAIRRVCSSRQDNIMTARLVETLQDRYKVLVPGWAPPVNSKTLTGKGYFSDTLVALISCRKYLDTRAQECRDTWMQDLAAVGVQVLVFCGSDDTTSEAHVDTENGIVHLAVRDAYEDLPAKSIEVCRWVLHNRDEQFILKIDDDCYLDAENFLTSLFYRRNHYFGRQVPARHDAFERLWHQGKSARAVNQRAIDTSLLGSLYADGGGGYVLSRSALRVIDDIAGSELGIRLRLASFFEDKMIGDMLRAGGIHVSSEGYVSLQARRTHSSALPVLQWDRLFYPSALSGIPIAHLDAVGLMASIRDNRASARLSPPRIWTMSSDPGLEISSNMLELLTHGDILGKLDAAKTICVAAFRNEMEMLPHFLQHYRMLGIDLFLIADNLSDDGTREYLLEQPDVVLFSAGNDYKDSHFAVDWQRMLLDHFCAGRWVVVADADEFLLLPKQGDNALKDHIRLLDENGYDAALVCMIDMYPEGPMADADFSIMAPQDAARGFDQIPLHLWPLNCGPYGNIPSYVSAVRHRLMPMTAPQGFTSQKVALFRFNPLMSFSEGFHFGTGMRIAPEPVVFLHYKFSAAFAAKAKRESLRGQHFGGGTEYLAYLRLIESGVTSLWQDGVSQRLDLGGVD